MKKLFIYLFASILILSTISSCKKSKDTGTDSDTGVNIGFIATNFSEQNSNGDQVTLDQFRGNVIILTFSTMWCGPCRMETSELVEIYNQYKEQGLEIFQIIYQDEEGHAADLSDLARWIDEFGIIFTVCTDPNQSTVNTYQFSSLPFNIVIDRDFVIRFRNSGYAPGELADQIQTLL